MNKGRIFQVFILIVVLLLHISFFYTRVGHASSDRFIMSYLYFGDVESQIKYVNQTNGALDVVSPSYFDLKPDGTLKISSKFSLKFIDEMHKQNVKVVPFLSNHWNRELGRKALENSEYLTNQIAAFVKGLNLDGVNVDLENLTHDDKEDYVAFVKMLREKIPAEKEVSVAVAANPYGFKLGWHGSYDYVELAKYADYLMIMAYDESYYGSKSGPIASIGFVEESIKFALERVSPDKIVLGIPFYGRYWNLNEVRGGRGIHLTDLSVLLKETNAKTVYSEKSQSPMAVFQIKEGDDPYYVYGRRLTPGIYSTWYENEDSIKTKLALVNKYNLKGTGSWSLGQELPSTWDYYSDALKANSTSEEKENVVFPDIKDHWALGDILSVNQRGWMKGYDNGLFVPDSYLTRAQAAVTIVRAFKLEKSEEISDSFADVMDNHWAKKEIEIAKKNGIINGVDNKNFLPDNPITREEMAVMIDRLLDFEVDIIELQEPLYVDVEKERWSYSGIYTMTLKGLFNGYDNGTFGPKDKITRAQMASLLNRMVQYIF